MTELIKMCTELTSSMNKEMGMVRDLESNIIPDSIEHEFREKLQMLLTANAIKLRQVKVELNELVLKLLKGSMAVEEILAATAEVEAVHKIMQAWKINYIN